MTDSDLERRLERMYAGYGRLPVDADASWRRFIRLRRHAAIQRRAIAAGAAAAIVVAAVAAAVDYHGNSAKPSASGHVNHPAHIGHLAITARIAVSGAGRAPGDEGMAGVVAGEGDQVWAITYAGRLIRIDPMTNRVTFSEHIAGLLDMAAGSGAIWVLTSAGKPNGHVLKIDPVGGQIVAAFPLQRRCDQVAFGGGELWLACGSGATTFLRLDPASGRVLAEGGLAHNVSYIAATADGVWYASDWGVSGFVGKGARLRWVHATDAVIPVSLGYTDSLVYGQGFLWTFTNDEGVAKINPATGRIVRIYGYQNYDPSYSMGLDFFTVGLNSLWFLADAREQATSVLRVSLATGRPQGEVSGVGSCGEPCWQIYVVGGSAWVPTITHITRIDPVSRPPRTGRR